MYRYSVDNAVTYTPLDLTLFRASPFALWMERLTLENPGHGIPPDVASKPPEDDSEPQDDLVNTLRAEGRDVALIDWDADEASRRRDTLDAMRSGADFIVNAQLALGQLSGSANMLMRAPGFSDYGDYLYMPCDTQGREVLEGGFRLAFIADLLASLQGQMPPRLLMIRGNADVVPLQTDDHIHYYRAVKQRFLDAMSGFRKHRMPDPSQSAHFGRWAECASEVLCQRAQSADFRQEAEEEALLQEEQLSAEPVLLEQAAGDAVGMTPVALDISAPAQVSAPTLAEQARQLAPDAFRESRAPGRTPNLAQFPLARVAAEPQGEPEPDEPAPFEATEAKQRTADDALSNLSFIGRAADIVEPPVLVAEPSRDVRPAPEPALHTDDAPAADEAWQAEEPAPEPEPEPDEAWQAQKPAAEPEPEEALSPTPAPSPSLREVPVPEPVIEGYEVEVIDLDSLELETREPLLLPPEGRDPIPPAGATDGVDLDGVPPPRLVPVVGVEPEADAEDRPPSSPLAGADSDEVTPARRFSDSLITNEDFDGDT